MRCKRDEILLSGPAGTGKSRACLEKLLVMALKYPGMRGLIVRKTLASLGSTALVTWREKVAAVAIETGTVSFYGGSPQESPQYKFDNGSVIVIGGMDKSSKIMSSEYDVVYVQEAAELTLNDWEAITTRLRNGVLPYQQIIADCNPDRPTHWLNERCNDGATLKMESRHEDNPVLVNPDGTHTEQGAAYLAKLDALTGVRYLRLRKGVWAAADGIIYEDWDEGVHLIDRFPIPDDWPRYWAVDFGFTNPFVCQMWAEDPDGRLYLYREIYRTRRTVDQHCATIARTVMRKPIKREGEAWEGEWKEPRPRAIVCDHDAEGRAQLQKELGISTKPAIKRVKDGIQAVQGRLRRADDGKPRLFIMRDALVERDPDLVDAHKPTCTAEEIVGYVWATRNTARAGELVQEEPLKEGDHGQDAKRYLVAYRDLGSRSRVRFMTDT